MFDKIHVFGDCGPMSTPLAQDRLDRLTDKQRQVLDLLIEHKTSKEIARTLGISPHTVDQRITLARIKLGLSSRGGIAQEYRRLRDLCERDTYEESYLGRSAPNFETSLRDDPESLLIEPSNDRFRWRGPAPEVVGPVQQEGQRVVPELFDGPLGTLIRLGAIGGIAILLEFVALVGISLFVVSSRLMQ